MGHRESAILGIATLKLLKIAPTMVVRGMSQRMELRWTVCITAAI